MAEPVFVLFRVGGKVHIYKDTHDFTAAALGVQPSAASILMASQRSICGSRGMIGRQYGITAFRDEDLCGRCRQIWPGDPVELFQHEVPNG